VVTVDDIERLRAERERPMARWRLTPAPEVKYRRVRADRLRDGDRFAVPHAGVLARQWTWYTVVAIERPPRAPHEPQTLLISTSPARSHPLDLFAATPVAIPLDQNL
jgi:hypothetical protein